MKKIFALILIVICLGGCASFGSSAVLVMDEDSGDDYWKASYVKFNGYKERYISVSGEGEHTFSVEIVTDSGELGLTIEDGEGEECYTGNELPSTSFTVGVDSPGKYTLRVDADDHTGSFNVKWE